LIKLKQPQSAAKRVVMNTGILYAKMGITIFISLYTTRLILNSLGVSDFGIFNIVGGAIAMLGFLNAAMAGATQRFMSYAEGEGNRDKQKNIFNISVVLHFGIAVLLGIVLLGAGYFFFNGILNIPEERMYAARMIYYFMIVSTMFTVMTVPYDAVLNAHENMLYYAIVGIIESVLKLVVALIVVYTLSDKLIVYGALMAGISLLVMIIMRMYCHRKYEECVFHPRRYYDKALMKEMSGFAGWNFLTSSSSMIGQYGLGVVLNHFFGTILNAAQGIANQLCGQLQVFSNTMLKALNPVITKSEGAGNRSLMLQASMSGCKFSFFLLAFFAIPFLIDADFIMKLWLKNVPEWGVVFFRFQIVRTLIEQLTIVLGVSISAQGDIVGLNKVKSILNILPVAFTAILFHLGYSPYYMYIIWIFCWSILGGGTNIFYVRKKCNLSIRKYLHGVLNPCLVLFCIVFGAAYIPYIVLPVGIIRFLCIAIISILCLLILLWFFGLNKSEKQIIRRLAHIKY
jgi:O-antigen/teichoic acid export membrane protein